MKEIEAYSAATGKTYPNWSALIEAESNGWLMVVVITNTKTGRTWPWVVGPVPTKEEAEKIRARTRQKWKRDQDQGKYAHLAYSFFVRPAWKEQR